MYVKLLKVTDPSGTAPLTTVFDGWFPPETGKDKILELLNAEAPGVIAGTIITKAPGETDTPEGAADDPGGGTNAQDEGGAPGGGTNAQDEGGAPGAGSNVSVEAVLESAKAAASKLVVELKELNGTRPEYCGLDGRPLDPALTARLAGAFDKNGEVRATELEGCAMLVLLPGERPYMAYIADKLAVLQHCVQGYIEITYPFADNCIVIGNEEAKLIGMQGNRRINGEIYAGPLLFAGDDYLGGFCDLNPAQVIKYMRLYFEPENISSEAVDGSIRIEVFAV